MDLMASHLLQKSNVLEERKERKNLGRVTRHNSTEFINFNPEEIKELKQKKKKNRIKNWHCF